jgi:hypothetical protein
MKTRNAEISRLFLGTFLAVCLAVSIGWTSLRARGDARRNVLLAPTLTNTIDLRTPSPSPTATEVVESPTPSPTFTEAPFSPTPTFTEAVFSPTPTFTDVFTPSETPEPSATPTLEPANTPTSQPPPTPLAYHYILQGGTPAGMKNFLHSDRLCSWMGVTGQVFGQDGKPIENLIVEAWGKMSGTAEFVRIAITGAGKSTGPGGYEITLADQLASSDGALRIQLLDGTGKPLSAAYPFTVQGACEQNLVVVNFAYIGVTVRNFLPLLIK